MSADDDNAVTTQVGAVPRLRAFQRPALWLGLWIFGWLLCVILSLIRAPSLAPDVPNLIARAPPRQVRKHGGEGSTAGAASSAPAYGR